jgi:ribosomal protein S18 acetylase RimI-like enzyme
VGRTAIRAVRRSDVRGLVALMAEHAAFERSEPPSASPSALLSAISYDPPRILVWVGMVSDQMVGYVSATRDFSTWHCEPFLHMDCLYVQEPYRGVGLGRRLIAKLVRFASQNSIRELQWQTPEWNVAASSFYRSLGAVERRKRRFTYGVGLVRRT